MQSVHLKCWNDKSHCQVSVVRLKSQDVSPFNELLLLPIITGIKNFLAWEYFFVTPLHISRHLEFIIEQGHRVNWVSGSLVPGSLGHKMWPSSMSDIRQTDTFVTRGIPDKLFQVVDNQLRTSWLSTKLWLINEQKRALQATSLWLHESKFFYGFRCSLCGYVTADWLVTVKINPR